MLLPLSSLLKNARNSSLGLPIKVQDDLMMRIAVFGDDAATPGAPGFRHCN
jgi:hypothetical protein